MLLYNNKILHMYKKVMEPYLPTYDQLPYIMRSQ